MHRKFIAVTVAVAAAAGLSLTACSSSGGGGGNGTVAGKMLLGGPPEFKDRRFGPLEKAYGITFQGFKPLDEAGPLTVTALKNGQVDAADIFTSDPAIKANNFVVLQDTKHFFGTQNIVPVINKSKATANVQQVLNFIDAKITDTVLINLRTQVEVDKKDPVQVATTWLESLGSQPPANFTKGVSLTIGSANFPENELLADIYAVALKATGANVKTHLNIGAREKYFPALEDGEIDLVPEYLGSVLSYLDPKSTAVTASAVEAALAKVMPKKLEILKLAPGQDNDAIVVTKATADKYGLKTIADLGKKA